MIFTKIMVIYPEEMITRIAVYKNVNLVFLKDILHKKDELASFKTIAGQYEYRKEAILNELKDNEIDTEFIRIVIARGGLIKPVKSGIYTINKKMKDDLVKGISGEHAINLGGLLADGIAKVLPQAKAYVADPVVVDELDDLARVTGLPMFQRRSVFHALNQKYTCRNFAHSSGDKYANLNLIVAHVGGGGISIGYHCKGRVIDVNNAFDGDGPFALSRTGSLPVGDLVRLCFSGKYSKEEILRMITSEGGLYAHLGTKNIDEIDKRISEGDEKASFMIKALAYQIAKEIGAMYTVSQEPVDAILLTGEIFNIQDFTNFISDRVKKFAKVVVFPLVDDMDALADNGMMVVKGEAEILEYK